MNRFYLQSLLFILLSFPCYALAEEEKSSNWSAIFDATSNYVDRGISASDNDPAAQATITYSVPKTDLYLGLWYSYVNIPLAEENKFAHVELQPFIGFAGEIKENWSYDIGFAPYIYPNGSELDYNEFILALTYRIFTGYIAYSRNVYNTPESGTYYNFSINYPLPESKYSLLNGISLGTGIGYYELPLVAGNSYLDYFFYIEKTIKHITFSLKYTDTNHKLYNNYLDGSMLIATVSVQINV